MKYLRLVALAFLLAACGDPSRIQSPKESIDEEGVEVTSERARKSVESLRSLYRTRHWPITQRTGLDKQQQELVRQALGEPRGPRSLPRSGVSGFEHENGWLIPKLNVDAQRGRARVRLPASAQGAMELRDRQSGMMLQIQLESERAASAEEVEGYVLYADAGKHWADRTHRVWRSGVDDFVQFPERRTTPRARYIVELGDKVAGLRVINDVVEFLDEQGVPRLRMAASSWLDSQGRQKRPLVSVNGCDVDQERASPLVRPLVPPGNTHCEIVVELNPEPPRYMPLSGKTRESEAAYPAVIVVSWQITDVMARPRYGHSATKIAGGRVLIVGGVDHQDDQVRLETELYIPAHNAFLLASETAWIRRYHTATMVNELVFVAGGEGLAPLQDPGSSLGPVLEIHSPYTYEVFDFEKLNNLKHPWSYPGSHQTYTTSNCPNLHCDRNHHTAHLLEVDGKRAVVLIGGMASVCTGCSITTQGGGACEYLVIPDTVVPNTDIDFENLQWKRCSANKSENSFNALLHRSAALNNRYVLVTGGLKGITVSSRVALLDFGKIVNMQADGWMDFSMPGSLGTPMLLPRFLHTATLLNEKTVSSASTYTVLLAGGLGGGSFSEKYSVTVKGSGLQSAVTTQASPTVYSRSNHTATKMGAHDRILVAGGGLVDDAIQDNAEVYDIPTGHWLETDGMVKKRRGHTATELDDGQVLVAGGHAQDQIFTHSEVFRALNLGESCTQNGTCLSGHCVSYRCCDAACDGPCAKCNDEGICGVVEAGQLTEASCSPYLCDGEQAACPDSCTEDSDCVSDLVCAEETCGKPIPPAALFMDGADCGDAAQCMSGNCVDGACCVEQSCAPYRCAGKNGTCTTRCKTTADCHAGSRCSGEGSCLAVETILERQAFQACGFVSRSSQRAPGSAWWWLFALGLARARRRAQ